MLNRFENQIFRFIIKVLETFLFYYQPERNNWNI